MKTIYFDMDGTIADLYGFPNWLEHLTAEKTLPYEKAKTLGNIEKILEELYRLKMLGFRVGVVSWTAKFGSKVYNRAVRKAKIQWLKENFPIELDEIRVVKYGTRKDYVVNDKNSLIFDDDEKVRSKWRGVAVDPTQEKIHTVLARLG